MQAHKEDTRKLRMLKTRSEFLHVRNKGKKWVSHGLILQVCLNDGQGMRIGFTVSKKVDKSAVKRNRIKRRLRAAAADILPQYASDNTDYVLIGRPQTAIRPYESLKNDLKWCLKKMGYNKKP